MTARPKPAFNRETFDAFLAIARRAGLAARPAAQRLGSVSKSCRCPSRGDEEWMRTDIRMFRLDQVRPCRPSRRPAKRRPTALLTHGVELAGQTAALDSRPHSAQLADKLGRARRAVRQPRRTGARSMAT